MYKNNIGSLLTKRASINPKREAYVDSKGECRLSFEQLNERCNQVANGLVKLGVKPGDRVALALMNSAEFIESYFAIAKIGAVIVPLNWRLVPDELEFILKDSGAQTLIFGEEFSAAMEDLHGRGEKTDVNNWLVMSPNQQAVNFAQDYIRFKNACSIEEPEHGAFDDELLYIMYTSGTTGLPKGVVHSHNTCLWACLTFSASCDLRDNDRYLVALPLFHVGALTPATLNIYRGVCSVVMREFDPELAWEVIEKEKVNNSLLVPAMLNFMAQVPNRTDFDHSSLRWVQCGASPLPVNLIQQYSAMGIDIHQIYGLTETCGPACVLSAEYADKKIGSTGRAFFHTEVKVVDERGVDCAIDEPGEVWVRGRHIMLEYWNRPDATADTLTADKWLKTGDVASVDEDGFVFIQDRIKDMIISGGENVYPAELENVILAHPGVSEVAVVGQPSEQWGESPLAVVVANDGKLEAQEILDFCNGKMARFKLPKAAVFVDTLPRNASGKVLKRELRELFPGPASS